MAWLTLVSVCVRRPGRCAVVAGGRRRRRGWQGDRAAERHRRRVANCQPADCIVLRAVRLGRARDRRALDRRRRQLSAMAAAAAAACRGRLGVDERRRRVQCLLVAPDLHRQNRRRRRPPGQKPGAGRRRNRPPVVAAVFTVRRRRYVNDRRRGTVKNLYRQTDRLQEPVILMTCDERSQAYGADRLSHDLVKFRSTFVLVRFSVADDEES